MIAAFVKENDLATIVGTTTAGRMLSGRVFKGRHAYMLYLPVAAHHTWRGASGRKGISPHIHAELPSKALRTGRDAKMDRALEKA